MLDAAPPIVIENETWIPLRPNRASQCYAGQEATAGQVEQDGQDIPDTSRKARKGRQELETVGAALRRDRCVSRIFLWLKDRGVKPLLQFLHSPSAVNSKIYFPIRAHPCNLSCAVPCGAFRRNMVAS